jgi:alpha/beta superfamily hydrolase
LRKSGCVVLRFNYRGVNLSEGEYGHGRGELDDARVALEELRKRYPGLPIVAGGFSFGSRVVLQLTRTELGIERVIAVGFPTKYPNREYVYEVRAPKHFVQSTNDAFGPRAEFTEFYESLPGPKTLDWVEAEDHFFKNNLDGYEAVIERIGRERPVKFV